MPNRILKESICVSESVNSLNWFEEVLFYRLIVNCDDYGRYDARPLIIKNKLFPLKDNLTVKVVTEAINKLASIGLVVLYENDGRPYLYLPKWDDHQSIRAHKSKYPDPKEENSLQVNDFNCIQMHADVPVIQSYSESNSVSESISESKSKARAGAKKVYAEDPELNQAILDFIEYRKKTKNAMTDKAIELFLNRLNTLSDSVDGKILLINTAIERGWKTVYEPKDYSRPSSSTQDRAQRAIEEVASWV